MVKELKPSYHLFGHIHDVSDLMNAGTCNISGINTTFSNGTVVTDNKFGTLTSNGNILEI